MSGPRASDGEILKALQPGPATARQITDQVTIAKSTVHRRLRALQRAGLVLKAGERYTLLPRGEEQLAQEPEGDPPSWPLLPIAQLELLPTSTHRAFAELVLLARIARRDRLAESHHPSFVLMGPPLRGKTTLLTALCHLMGADPRHQVLHVGSETEGSLSFRRGATGKITTSRRALEGPIVGLDEWTKAKAGVRRRAEVLLHGELSIALEEDDLLDLRCVVVLALNPHAKASTLGEACDLDPGRLRRCVVLNLADLELPGAVVDDGEAYLEQIRELGPIELPCPRVPDWNPNGEIRQALHACLRAPHSGEVDVNLVGLLVRAATAFFDRREALAHVLASYLCVTETTGWTQEDWRKRLAEQLGAGPPTEVASEAHAPTDNPFSYDAALVQLGAMCDRLALAPSDAEGLLRDLLPLSEVGLHGEALEEAARQLRTHSDGATTPTELLSRLERGLELGSATRQAEAHLATVQAEVERARAQLAELAARAEHEGFAPDEVPSLRWSQRALTSLALSTSDLRGLASALTRTSGTLGVPLAEAALLVVQLLEVVRLEAEAAESSSALADPASLAELIVTATKAGQAVSEGLRLTQTQAKRAERRLASLQQQVARRRVDLEVVQAEAGEAGQALGRALRDLEAVEAERIALLPVVLHLRDEACARREQLTLATDLLNFLGGRARLTPKVAAQLYSAACVPRVSVGESGALRRRLLSLLEPAQPAPVAGSPSNQPPTSGGEAASKGAPTCEF